MDVRTAGVTFAASITLVCVGVVSALPVSGAERVDIEGATTVAPGTAGWTRLTRPSDLGTDGPMEAGSPLWDPAARGAGSRSGEVAPDPQGSPRPEADDEPVAPVALAIPALGMISGIVPTGLTQDREMEIPPVDRVGWYRHGVLPGSTSGSAVLAAHVDYDGEPGAFGDLGALQLGEPVLVTDARGGVHEYVVTERYQLDKRGLAAANLFERGGDPVLTLVTCGGGFERTSRSYTDNIVVRARPA